MESKTAVKACLLWHLLQPANFCNFHLLYVKGKIENFCKFTDSFVVIVLKPPINQK